MQRAVECIVRGQTLRGMEHVPEGVADKLPAVILFHGFTGTKLEPHRMFLKISRALENLGIACFRFDFSGSGESDGNFEDMTLNTELEEASAILDWVRQDARIDVNRINLLGLSMGGLVASLVAGDRPQDIHRLALLAPAGNINELIAHAMATYGVDERTDVFDYAGNLIGRGFPESLQNIRVFERAKQFQGPVLLAHGTKDEAVPYQVSLKYQEVAYEGRAVLHILEGADHTFNTTPWEQAVITHIRDFFQGESNLREESNLR